jgi:hypothetical protein
MSDPGALRFALAGILVLAGSCGTLQERDAAEKAVDRFHQLFNEASFSVIYNEADPQFQRSMTVPDFDQLLRAMQRDLGAFRQARRTSFQSEGSTAALMYDSDFAKANATERFGYAIRDRKAYLISYTITSPALRLQ